MDKFREGIKAITNSKFVFLDTCERTYYVGDFIDENGLKFSNGTYKTYTSYLSDYSYNWKNWKYSDDYYFDDDIIEEKAQDIEKETDNTFEYYDAQKGLIYLQKGWAFYCEEKASYEEVSSEFDFVYDLNTGELYTLTDLGYLTKYDDFETVYDEQGFEIF